MSQNSSGASPIQVAARVNKLLTISQKYDKKLQTSTMQAINISFVSVLTSAEAGLTEPLQNSGIDYKKQKKEILKMEPAEKMDKKLEDALCLPARPNRKPAACKLPRSGPQNAGWARGRPGPIPPRAECGTAWSRRPTAKQ